MIDRVHLLPERMDGAFEPRRLLFHYYKDRYAAMLLGNVLQPRLTLRDLRKGRYGRLLERPALKALAAAKGDGWLDRDDVLALWPHEVETYVLSFGTWGDKQRRERRWNQTTRPGRQLVLQLNFSRQHDAEYERLIFNAKDMPFVNRWHPVNRSGRNTMAWARIDIDFPSGEALIEEVQSDWIRIVRRKATAAARGYGSFRAPARRRNLEIYSTSILAPHAAMWSEAVLTAALHVLIVELGIGRIWFHDFDTGCEIKKLKEWKAPRSLYTDLPKRFCFELTDEPPEFILPVQTKKLRRKLERGEGRFWRFDAQPLTV